MCVFHVVTDVEVVPVDKEALSVCVCVFLVVTDVEVVPVDREALSVCSLLGQGGTGRLSVWDREALSVCSLL